MCMATESTSEWSGDPLKGRCQLDEANLQNGPYFNLSMYNDGARGQNSLGRRWSASGLLLLVMNGINLGWNWNHIWVMKCVWILSLVPENSIVISFFLESADKLPWEKKPMVTQASAHHNLWKITYFHAVSFSFIYRAWSIHEERKHKFDGYIQL